MKLTVILDNLAALTRLDPARLLADLERELQAAASDAPPDAAARRDALERVLRRFGRAS